jgi:ankyrin repeat protein
VEVLSMSERPAGGGAPIALADHRGVAAARAGDIEALDAWLGEAHDPDQPTADGWTPLLWAAARAHVPAIDLLLARGAEAGRRHPHSDELPVHLAAQSGVVEAVGRLLDRRPGDLDAVCSVNGHTPLLQAVFYGHLPLAAALLERGADTARTTARGLGPLELAAQFENDAMVELVRPHDRPAADKAAAYRDYLAAVAPTVAPGEEGAQARSDRLATAIEQGLAQAAHDPEAVERTLAAVRHLLDEEGTDVNRLGGPLQQPPIITTVTGNNGFPPNPAMDRLRTGLADLLLERGADPTVHEKHPMAVQAVIRAAVFNHLDILRRFATVITPQQLADAINEWPPVNGLTALHDTVLRATMADPARFEGYLDQTRWFMANGGRADIEDFAGRTQRNLAEAAADPKVRRRLLDVLDGRDTAA